MMNSQSLNTQLLRMLNPAVRPDGVGGGAVAPRLPIESQSFEALLAQVQEAGGQPGALVESEAAGSAKPQAAGPGGPGVVVVGGEVENSSAELTGQRVRPLNNLSQFDAVDNASLRQWMASQRQRGG